MYIGYVEIQIEEVPGKTRLQNVFPLAITGVLSIYRVSAETLRRQT